MMADEDFETFHLVFSVRRWNIIKRAVLVAVRNSIATQEQTEKHLIGYPHDAEAMQHLAEEKELTRTLYEIADHISRNVPGDNRR